MNSLESLLNLCLLISMLPSIVDNRQLLTKFLLQIPQQINLILLNMRNRTLHPIRPPRPLRIEIILKIPSQRMLIIRQPRQPILRNLSPLKPTISIPLNNLGEGNGTLTRRTR